jgi:hypothetical protein
MEQSLDLPDDVLGTITNFLTEIDMERYNACITQICDNALIYDDVCSLFKFYDLSSYPRVGNSFLCVYFLKIYFNNVW